MSTVADKTEKLIELMKKVLGSVEVSAKHEKLVLDWLNTDATTLAAWVESEAAIANPVNVKTVAKFLQTGDVSPFVDEDEPEEEKEKDDKPTDTSNGYKRFEMGEIDPKALFADGKSYIERVVNDAREPLYQELKAERKKTHEMTTKIRVLSTRKPKAADGEDTGLELSVPDKDPHFVWPRGMKPMIESVFSSTNDRVRKVLNLGPPSTGKSKMPEQAAAMMGRKFFSINCAVVREASAWFGQHQAKRGSTFFEVSQFVRAIEEGANVVRMDEINRLSPYIQNPLLELLEDGRTHIDGYGMVEIGPETVFFATANVGMQYHGTYKFCDSLMSRFPVRIEFKPLSEKQTTTTLVKRTGVDEEIATKLAAVQAQVYSKCEVVGTGSYDRPITYRQLEAACELYQQIGNEAFKLTLLNHYDNDGADSDRSRLAKLIAGQGLA